MAERLRNLGKFTFADVAAFRFSQTPIRACLPLPARAGGGLLPDRPNGGCRSAHQTAVRSDHWMAVVIVRALDDGGVLFGGMAATTWVQIIRPACCSGASFMAFGSAAKFGFSPEPCLPKRRNDSPGHPRRSAGILAGRKQPAAPVPSWPGRLRKDPISNLLRHGPMFGTAGLPHILMRFFTVANAKKPKSGSVGPPGSATSTS